MKRFEDAFGLIAGLALFLMMWLTFVDVVGRKFFAQSVFGGVELTELLMMIAIFFALPLTSWLGGHIVFDLLDRFLPEGVRQWQQGLAHGLTALIMLGGAWVVFDRAGRTMEYGDTTAQLAIPMYPFHFMISLLLVVTALIHLLLAAHAAHAVRALR